ncbi:putative bifunctional diguanylate cyclase/phosphodiesterase [Pseudooceanicola nitratireducens]|uniref:putative bifunctional diguanylate cyclase/phosphodiesterase n=1 Tax=Pseudooceanicola nitratireducens TaxID=517719 RepID=UPI003C7AB370
MNVMQGFPVAMDLLHQDFPISMSAQLQDSARLQDAPAMTELESTLEQFRTTVETACGAAASLFLILPGESGHTPPLVTLTADTQLGRQLYEAAMAAVGSLRAKVTMCPSEGIDSPCSISRFSLSEINFDVFSFLVKGPEAGTFGLFAMAVRANPGQQSDLPDKGRKIALCFGRVWNIHDNMSEMAFELATLSSRMARLRKLSETDPLTNLNNRVSFENKVRERIEDGGQHFAFVIIDVDHFKMINDIYGHQFGDTYLKAIAKTLKHTAPEGAVTGRLGGDEFGLSVPLPRGGRAYLDGLLSRMKNNIQRAIAVLNKPDLGHVSIGASQFPLDASGYTKLYELADCALYAAKNAGRGKSAIFHPRHHVRYNTSELGNLFHQAVRRNQIHPNFQPIVDLESRRCIGFEVLARWRDDTGKNMIPAQFSTVFRDHSLAEKMTRTIMRRAFQDYGSSVSQTFPHRSLSINVTYFDLMNPEFVFDVQNVISETSFGWENLTIEVTEQIMLDDTNGQIRRTVKELRTRGARIALDDFGTGYGGLRHLSDWPIDFLKIDKAFVDKIGSDDKSVAILRALLAMANGLGVSVIAEGIETAQQAALLRDWGCRLGQGFLFDAPLPSGSLAGYDPKYSF